MLSVGEIHTLMGFEEVWTFDEKWAEVSDSETSDHAPD
jgi:hypothetical protein